jgi:steroid 5-alpha reductase family enzyme
MIQIVLVSWAGLAVVLAGLWYRQTRTRNATSVDVVWAAALGTLALVYAASFDGNPARRLLVGALAGIWGFRLAAYLLTDRVLRATEEDGRYRAMRAHWGTAANAWFFVFYQGQALVAVLFSLPIAAAMQGGPPDGWFAAGAGVWLTAVIGETIADRQLARFRANPANRGQVCDRGLWRYSRHPNYFFEWVHWWAYVLMAHGAPLSWIGPATMWLILFRLTGIPYTEQQALKSRGDAYRRYQQSTSVFFPWPPREAS